MLKVLNVANSVLIMKLHKVKMTLFVTVPTNGGHIGNDCSVKQQVSYEIILLLLLSVA